MLARFARCDFGILGKFGIGIGDRKKKWSKKISSKKFSIEKIYRIFGRKKKVDFLIKKCRVFFSTSDFQWTIFENVKNFLISSKYDIFSIDFFRPTFFDDFFDHIFPFKKSPRFQKSHLENCAVRPGPPSGLCFFFL